MKKLLLAVMLVGFMLVQVGCTRPYRPVSDWEASVYGPARKDVYPDDVKASLGEYREELLVWPGILKRVVITERGDKLWAELTIEHHYYDWLEDGSVPRYWLSPRGEGVFTAAWSMPKEWGLKETRRSIHEGDMMVVYGYPEGVSGGVVQFGHAEYVRLIPQYFYSTGILDYGRRGPAAGTANEE